MQYIALLLLLIAPLAQGAFVRHMSPDELRVSLEAKTAELAKTQERLAQVREALAEERHKIAALEKRLAALEKARAVPAVQMAERSAPAAKPEVAKRNTTNRAKKPVPVKLASANQERHEQNVAAIGAITKPNKPSNMKKPAAVIKQAPASQRQEKPAPNVAGNEKDVFHRLKELWPKGVSFDLRKVSFHDVRRDEGGLVAKIHVNGKPLTKDNGEGISARGSRLETLAVAVFQAKS